MKNWLLLIAFLILSFVFFGWFVNHDWGARAFISPTPTPNLCKQENAECQWNMSGNNCCAGLSCNYWKWAGGPRYKCEPSATPTPTPTARVTPTPTIAPTAIPTVTPSATPEPSDNPTPTPEPQEEIREPEHNDPGFSIPQGPFAAPSCEQTAPVNTGANFHVYRSGGDAILKWVPTQGSTVNIYYKQVNSTGWQYSLRDIPNHGTAEVHDLGSLDITFALQQSNGCAGGPLTQAVIDGATHKWVLYR
jgi:hypothetical protein